MSRGTKLYELEILDNIHDMKHLTELNRINPSVFFLISLTTVLYKWQGDQESLLTAIKPVLADHKKYAIFEVSDITASSFLPVDYLQGLIRK